jgi:hypothetical protein
MEAQIHILEQEAYSAVLRAFQAQADEFSWDKATVMTNLRKELRISDDENRQLLNNVHNDDLIKRIRDSRPRGGNQVVRHQSLDVHPSPTFSASRKKQKTFQSYPSIGSTRSKSFNNRVVSANEPAEALIGRKVWTKWPEDNSFYEAVVTQYNANEVTSDG